MTQLSLPLRSTPEPTRSVFADLGRYMVGEGPRPVELDAVTVARLHRERVRASWGAR